MVSDAWYYLPNTRTVSGASAINTGSPADLPSATRYVPPVIRH